MQVFQMLITASKYLRQACQMGISCSHIAKSIFGKLVPVRVFFDSIDTEPEFMAQGRARGPNLGNSVKCSDGILFCK